MLKCKQIMTMSLITLSLTSCFSASSPQPKAPLTRDEVMQAPLVKYVSEYGRDAVIWADKQGMYISDVEGQLKAKLRDQGASWCAMDHRTGLLWYESGRTLYAWDLESQHSPKPILTLFDAAKIPVNIEHAEAEWSEDVSLPVIIKHLDGTRWMQPRTHQYQLGLEIDLSQAPPALELAVGCQGELSSYCYELDESSQDERLNQDLARLKAELELISLQNASWLGQIAQRARGRAQYKALPSLKASPAPLELDRDPCHEAPERCGEVIALHGTPYWAVHVSNGVGDLYHERWQLYNPQTKQFFFPPEREGQPEPIGELGVSMRELSPSGRAYISFNRLMHIERGPVLEADALCGFVAPGIEPPEPLR